MNELSNLLKANKCVILRDRGHLFFFTNTDLTD